MDEIFDVRHCHGPRAGSPEGVLRSMDQFAASPESHPPSIRERGTIDPLIIGKASVGGRVKEISGQGILRFDRQEQRRDIRSTLGQRMIRRSSSVSTTPDFLHEKRR